MSAQGLIDAAKQAIADAEAVLAAHGRGWIDVVKEHPPKGVKVLVAARGEILISYISSTYGYAADDRWTINSSEGSAHSHGITHWQPLPEPPK